jgi:hypothetical protein
MTDLKRSTIDKIFTDRLNIKEEASLNQIISDKPIQQYSKNIIGAFYKCRQKGQTTFLDNSIYSSTQFSALVTLFYSVICAKSFTTFLFYNSNASKSAINGTFIFISLASSISAIIYSYKQMEKLNSELDEKYLTIINRI